jgi:hypothetical protein
MKTEIELPNYNEIVFDILQKSTFGVVKCYNLVFNLNKKNNIGFWIFLFFLIIHLPFIIHFFIYGYKPILQYIKRELIIFNHSSKISNPKKKIRKNRIFNDNKKMKLNLYNIVNINNNKLPKGQGLGKSTNSHLLNDTNLYSSSIRPISSKKISLLKKKKNDSATIMKKNKNVKKRSINIKNTIKQKEVKKNNNGKIKL